MSDFSDNEKKNLLDAVESMVQIKTFLLGMDGSPGFCRRVEEHVKGVDDRLTEYIGKHDKLDKRIQWLIGLLVGAGVISGSTVGIAKLLGI